MRMYLICNSVQNCNDARQATADSNANNAGQGNTEDNKEHIETQKDDRQPENNKQGIQTLKATYTSQNIGDGRKKKPVNPWGFLRQLLATSRHPVEPNDPPNK